MSNDRQELIEELKLRKHIRKAIMIINERKMGKKEESFNEELNLREYIRSLLSEAGTPDPEDSPHENTGINYLKELLKKIIPVLEIDYKKLTTSGEQRTSFRAHIVQAVKNTLIPPKVTDEAGEESKYIPISEQIAVDVGDPGTAIGDEEKFIDIEDPSPLSDQEKEQSDFGLEGEDETGRDAAYNAFKKVEGSILDSWEILSSDEDQNLFFDYLITNLKLHFDRFEDELAQNIPEPTTDEYEAQTGSAEEAPMPPAPPEDLPPEEEAGPPLPPIA